MAEVGTRFLGFGSFLPEDVRTNDDWPEAFKARRADLSKRDVLAIDCSTRGEAVDLPAEIGDAMMVFADDPWRGARERRVIADRAEPSDMEAEAGRRAIAAAHLEPRDIDLVLVASLVPDRLHPSNGPAVQHKCGLVNAAAWSLDVGCASFQAHVATAAALIAAGAARHVLCVYSSAVSLVLDSSEGWSPNFGDGAAAMVIGPGRGGEGLRGHYARTDGSLREAVVYAPVIDGRPEPRWYRGDARVRLATLDVDGGKRTGAMSTAFCKDACAGALAAAGMRAEDIAFFVCNQSVGWLVDACRRSLGLRREQTIDSFAEVGNIGAAVVPFHLERAWRTGRLRDGDAVLIYSPGAGLTRSAVVWIWRSPG